MNRWPSVVAMLIYLSGGLPGLSYAQSKTSAPTITVYKTPT